MKRNPNSTFWLLLILSLTSFAWPEPARGNLRVGIQRSNDFVLLSWPTGAVTYVLQSQDAPGTTNWMDITNTPGVVGTEKLLAVPATNDVEFYRLAAPGPSAPSLSGLANPPVMNLGSNGVITFNFLDPDCDIAFLEIVRSNALGQTTSSIPASAISISSVDGQSMVTLGTKDLAYGENLLTLRLRDSGGRVSGEMTSTVNLTGEGTGGSAPSLTSVSLAANVARQPVNPRDTLRLKASFDFSDADADVARLRVRVTDPIGKVGGKEFSAATLGLAGASGSFNGILLTFGSTHAPGNYTIEFTLFDRNGNASGIATRNFELSPFNGGDPLTITDVEPSAGPAGSTVNLYLSGFDPYYNNPASYRVTLGSEPVTVVEVDSWYVAVLVPSNALSGFFRVEAGDQVTYAEDSFNVPEILRLSPATTDAPELAVNASLQFNPQLIARGPAALLWSVNGVPGGNAILGTISANGLYQAPAAIPSGSNVTVSVRQASNPAVSNQAVVTVTAPPAKPGGASILAALGGSVKSADGVAGVTLPPWALAGNSDVTVRSLRGTNVPPDPPGLQMLGAAEFGPAGLTFTQAVITVPLVRHLPPGTLLSLMLFNPTNSSFTDLGPVAKVGLNGAFATAAVTHFSIYTVALPLPPSPIDPPGITNITPMSALEGAKVPVLLSGTNLTTDLVPEILLAGVPSDDIILGTLYTTTNQAGLLLDVQTITNLADGVPRVYTLRLRRIATAIYTDVNFTVNGLDELIVPSGQTLFLTNPPPRTYSEVHIRSNATLSVESGGLDIQVIGPVTVDGELNAEGKAGQSAVGYVGGAGAAGTAPGGGGGAGRQDIGCEDAVADLLAVFGHETAHGCAPPTAYGQDGSLVLASDLVTYGLGGQPGDNASLQFYSIFRSALSCFEGNFLSCYAAVAGVIKLVDTYGDISDGTPFGAYGENGVPADAAGVPNPGFGNGGGGAGAGGLLRLDFDTLGSGAGGGGGGGGRPANIATARGLHIGGRISTAGGAGGDGAQSPDVLSFPFAPLGSVEELLGGAIKGFGGGGGGGGSGARLTLTAGEPLTLGAGGRYSSAGGESGLRLITEISGVRVGLVRPGQSHAAFGQSSITDSSRARVAGSKNFATPTTVLDVATKVTSTSVVRARIFNETRLRIVHNGVTNDVIGLPEPVAYLYAVPVYRAQAVLQPGFNTLLVPGMHGLLAKKILYLPGADSDSDGISDADEIALGTNPNLADSDGDGRTDLQEVLFGSDPTKADTDGDGLTDLQEFDLDTNPIHPDTDGDGVTDGAEVALGKNPKLASSVPTSFPPNTLLVALNGPDTGGSRLAVINLATQRLGMFGKPAGGFGFGMAFDEVGTLFTLSGGSLATYNAFTDTSTPVGTLTDGILGGGLAYRYTDGQLYTMELGPGPAFAPSGQLVRINPGTAAATRIGTPLATAIRSLACTWDGKLFASVEAAVGGDNLVELHPATGAVLGTTGDIGQTPLYGLAFSRDLNLFASQAASATNGTIYQLDQTNATPTAQFGANLAFFDLTVAPKPTPALAPLWTFAHNHSYLRAVHAGNFNGDTHSDIVTMADDYAEERSVITLFTNDGAGNFTETFIGQLTWQPFGSDQPEFLAAGDLNGDGILDLAAANPNGVSPETLVFLSQTNGGGYTGHITNVLTHPSRSWWVGIASMNPSVDAHPDLVISTQTGLLVQFNNTGDGETFTESSLAALTPGYRAPLALGDLNGDGRPEIIAHGALYPNNGNGTFAASQAFTAGAFGPLAFGDFNGDGNADLAMTGSSQANPAIGLFVHFGNGSTTLPTAVSFAGDSSGTDTIAIGDLNQDGIVDIISGNYELGFNAYFRPGTAVQQIVPLPDNAGGVTFLGVTALTVHDFQSDTRPEIVTANFFDHAIKLYELLHPFKE